METESLCLLPTQMLRPVSCNPACSRGGGVRLQATKLQHERVEPESVLPSLRKSGSEVHMENCNILTYISRKI